jgi:hypothetical protein
MGGKWRLAEVMRGASLNALTTAKIADVASSVSPAFPVRHEVLETTPGNCGALLIIAACTTQEKGAQRLQMQSSMKIWSE